MATKVKALSTIAGSYGLAHKDDELEVRASEAKELEKLGLVEIVGETSADEKSSEFASNNLTTGKGNATGGVRITDNTGKPAKVSDPVKEEKKTAPKKGKK